MALGGLHNRRRKYWKLGIEALRTHVKFDMEMKDTIFSLRLYKRGHIVEQTIRLRSFFTSKAIAERLTW